MAQRVGWTFSFCLSRLSRRNPREMSDNQQSETDETERSAQDEQKRKKNNESSHYSLIISLNSTIYLYRKDKRSRVGVSGGGRGSCQTPCKTTSRRSSSSSSSLPLPHGGSLSALGRETNGIEFQQKLPLNLFLSLSLLVSPPLTYKYMHVI
jgi:hypothetical protein